MSSVIRCDGETMDGREERAERFYSSYLSVEHEVVLFYVTLLLPS